MKRKFKLLNILCVVSFIVILFTGCGKKIETIKAPTAQEAIDLFNQYNLESNIEEMVKLYSDVYIESVGYTPKQIIKMIKSNRSKATINSSTIKSMEDIDENTKKAVVTISATVNGEESTDDYIYAIVKEGDGWAVSPDGVTGCVSFDVPAPKNGELNLNLSKEIIQFDGVTIRVDVYNDSKTNYIFGTDDSKTEVIVETTEGTYNNILEESATVNKRTKSYFMAKIADIKGDITKVTVTSIYDADKDGNPVLDTKREITAYSK